MASVNPAIIIYYNLKDATFAFEDDALFQNLSVPDFDPFMDFPSGEAVMFTILSCVASTLCVLCFLFYVKHSNVPAATIIAWLIYLNLTGAANSLIWPTDDVSTWFTGEIYCDIDVKLVNAASFAIPGALCALFRGLAAALDTDNIRVSQSAAGRRREFIFNAIFCIFLPICSVPLAFVVQQQRYYVYAISGCVITFSLSWLALLFVFIPPVVLCFLAGYFAALVTYRVYRYRTQFASVLRSSGSNLSQSRFTRLYVLSLVQLMVVLPVQIYVLIDNVPGLLYPFSWAHAHDAEDWHWIGLAPMFGRVLYDRWIRLGAGFTVFFTLGLGQEAIDFYRRGLVAMGLGVIFPGLKKSLTRGNISPPRTSDATSFWSRTRQFSRKLGSIGNSTFTRKPSVLSEATMKNADHLSDTSGLSPTAQSPGSFADVGGCSMAQHDLAFLSAHSPTDRTPVAQSSALGNGSSLRSAGLAEIIPIHGRALTAINTNLDNKVNTSPTSFSAAQSASDRLFDAMERGIPAGTEEKGSGKCKAPLGMDGAADVVVEGDTKFERYFKNIGKSRMVKNLAFKLLSGTRSEGKSDVPESAEPRTESSSSSAGRHRIASTANEHLERVNDTLEEEQRILRALGIVD